MKPLTDEKTAAALAARSERAVADVIARYSRHLYTVAAAALRGVGTEQDAEEGALFTPVGKMAFFNNTLMLQTPYWKANGYAY